MVGFQFRDAVQDLTPLLFQEIPLALHTHRDFLKLAVSDNDGVIVAGGDPAAEPLAVLGFKVLPGRHQNIGRGVELQILRRPLLRQVVGHHEQAFLAQPQPLALLGGSYHFKCFPCPHHMGQQGVPSVEDVGDGVHLMGPQGDLWVDAHKVQVAPVILTGPYAVEFVVVEPRQPLPPGRVFPYPVLERLLDKLLLALGDSRFLLVQDGNAVAVFVLHIVKNTQIPEIQGFLYDLVAIDTGGAVGVLRLDIAPVGKFTFDIPCAGVLGVMAAYHPLTAGGSPEQFIDKLVNDLCGQPGGPQPDGDLAGGQVHRLHPFQRLDMGGVVLRVQFGASFCPFQLLPHIPGEVFVRSEVLFLGATAIPVHGVQEDHAGQVGVDLLLGLAGQLRHIVHVHLCLFSQ